MSFRMQAIFDFFVASPGYLPNRSALIVTERSALNVLALPGRLGLGRTNS